MRILGRVVIASNFSDFDKAKAWLLSLNLKGRKPRGIDNRNWNFLKNALHSLELIDKWGAELGDTYGYHENVMRVVNDLPPAAIDILSGKLGQDAPATTIKKGDITFIKEDTASYQRFLEVIEELTGFIHTLSGYHKVPTRNLTIKFVSATTIKPKAKYISAQDIIAMRLFNKIAKGEEYASPKYILLHELGHRYLKKHHQQGWDIDSGEWVTTPYSRKDSIMGGEEKFAELFAISHWPSKYHQYADTIKKFREKIQ